MIFATNALSYQVLSNYKMSYGSVSTIPSSFHRKTFIEDSHSIDIRTVATTEDRATGIDPVHLS